MATELNLNTLNWVTLACPDCAAEVQVLEDDVQSGLIHCPGCGGVISGGEAENEPAADEPAADDAPVEATRLEKDDSAKTVEVRGGNSQTETLIPESSKAATASEGDSPDGVGELLSGLPDIAHSGATSPRSEKVSAGKAAADEPKHDAHADAAVAESSSARPASDPPAVVEPAADSASDGSHSQNETAHDTDEARSESTSPAQKTVPELDEGELTQDASKDESVVAEESTPPHLPHVPNESAVENDVSVLDLAEETEEEDEEAEPATKLQWLRDWLQTRRRQLTGTAVSVAVHVVLLGILALIVFQIGQIDDSSAIDGRIGSTAAESELRDLEELPTEKVKIETTPNRLDISRITRQQTDPSVRPGEGQVPEISFEGPEGLLDTVTAEPKWQTPTGQGLEGRTAQNRAQLAMLHGGTEKSESAVEEGLKWLLQHQRPNGSWSFQHKLPTCTTRCLNPGTYDCPTGATGLALLCFLGAGYTHKEGPYQEEVGKALAWLVEQSCMGELQFDLSRDAPEARTGFYAQGMASIALCEAYGMTKDPALKQHAQDALDYISQAQDPVQGGWRYVINERGDTSVVGWQVMALVSGRMAGLSVSRSTRSKVLDFLTHVRSPGGDFGYTGRYGGTIATTSIGVLCTMYLDPLSARRTFRPKIKQLSGPLPMRNNLYANYYISQILHHFGGPEWTSWNSKMRNFLVSNQMSGGHGRGSWNSTRDFDVRGGRLYSTCMSILILEVYYRHLPLYQQDATLLKIPEVQATR